MQYLGVDGTACLLSVPNDCDAFNLTSLCLTGLLQRKLIESLEPFGCHLPRNTIPSYAMCTAPIVAITGGIASGKTSFRRHLSIFLEDTEWFDADACASRLLNGSREVRAEVEKVLGREIYVGGKLDRAQARLRIFFDPCCRAQLERVLHPRVRGIWMAQVVRSKVLGRKLLAELPLLYETGWETSCDFIMVIACSFATQLRRLASRGICDSLARKMIAVQLPAEEKVRRAHEVVWNDGPPRLLTEQARVTAGYLTKRYG